MKTKGKITAIISNLVTIEVNGPVSQNEICYVIHHDGKLMAEVIKVKGTTAYAQVFESTRGLKVGAAVDFTQNMLEITLAPGLLSKNYDGLQNNLDGFENLFLQRGIYSPPVDVDKIYQFTPLASKGQVVTGGSWLGSVRENWIDHKIMVPFKIKEKVTLTWLAEEGNYKVKDYIAKVRTKAGETIHITMMQKWPVKIPITNYKSKPRPFKLMQTGVRAIDTLNPMTEGGTGFIPGPFGAGKTVLQHVISKNADADLIVMAACGERANEVVEIFTEFPELFDTRTGRKLQERTTIICNTSNMPVAAREASVYVGMTIAEYYRSMGLKVLLLADSTSRWAQALREMSNRMEELPGPDAFPMDLSAIIANFYSRAGYVELPDGGSGSVTFIGTVSPAGGNLKEPVTESTQKVARCFYALSQRRADSKRYPAIEPLSSYSKYLEYKEFAEFTDKHIQKDWVSKVLKTKDFLQKGIEASEQINILGDDAVPIDYHVRFWKSELIDFVILQQDAFDEIDQNTPMHRQKYMLNKVLDICHQDFEFDDYEEARSFFKQIINLFRQMNYSPFESQIFKQYEKEIEQMLHPIQINY